ncbi:MAG: S9 family peptidase [Pseudomonadota bacterium]
MDRSIGLFTALLCGALSTGVFAGEANPDHYGQLPFVRSVTISPDGEHLAYIQRQQDGDYFVIARTSDMSIVGGANAEKIKARSVFFATNKHVVLRISKTTRYFGFRNKWENSGAVVYDIDSGKMRTLLRGTRNLYPAQSGLGYIVGLNPDEESVYMPAYVGDRNPDFHLMRVDLNGSRGRVHKRGTEHTTDWFVDSSGNVLAKEEYHEGETEHRVMAWREGSWHKVFSEIVDVPQVSFRATDVVNNALIFSRADGDGDALYSLSLNDGSITGPLYESGDEEIDGVITGRLTDELMAIRYAGMLPSYAFFDEHQQSFYDAVQSEYPTSSVFPVSATSDYTKLIYRVSGNELASTYVLLDTTSRTLRRFASQYPEIDTDDIGEIKVVRYKARDGLSIQAVITWPPDVKERADLPMLVLPHGGPAAYDSMRFDWWAQFFARRGYLILQPNFRGSSGSGNSFQNAGRGEWGRAMQDDVTDGVKAAIEAGYADPERVCIMGSSYGGYSALAGGAFTPDVYRCVISVAGVSDLPMMLRDVKIRRGRRHWVVSYWQKLIGDSKEEREKLKAISPANFAEKFTSPVLLLHGSDDTVVGYNQSDRMYKALRKHKKAVQIVKLKGEDHWLSDSDTRLAMLSRISEFLDKHNPVDR